MKKRWLLLGQLSHQLRAEHHPFITTKTRVFLSMDRTIAIHFFEIFFPKGGEPSLFSHVKFIFNASASNNAAKVNILPLIKLLHSAPDLNHSIISRNESGSTCNHAILDMLFAPQNSHREHIIAHNVQFTRIIYSPSYLEVHVRSEFAKPWMPVNYGKEKSGTKWKAADYCHVVPRSATVEMGRRRRHTRKWLRTAEVNMKITMS
jgi:hypothetical protein